MRRSQRGVIRLAAALAGAMLVTATAPTAHAGHGGSHDDAQLAPLITDVADANQRLADIGADIQGKQEGVNKALVEVIAARDAAEAARREAAAGEEALADADTAIRAAQQRFDEFAAATYINGPSGGIWTVDSPDDVVAIASAGHAVALSFEQARTALQRARTEQANKASAARAAAERADAAAAEAQRARDTAVGALTDAQHQFASQQVEVDRLVGERDAARARLAAARRPPHHSVASRARSRPHRPGRSSGTVPRPRAWPTRVSGIPPCRWCRAPTSPATLSRLSMRCCRSRRHRHN